MSVYNGSGKLVKTVDSILNQTFGDFEFIIVDDGSTDDSAEILAQCAARDARIRIIHQANAGLTCALDKGCRAARGSIIARQDVGDVSLPRRLEAQVALLQREPEVVAVGVGARRVGPEGELLGLDQRDKSPRETTAELLVNGTGICHAASAFRSSAFIEVGGYRPEFRFAQDTDLWLRLSERGLIAECPEVLFEVAVETQGISAQRTDQQVRLWKLARECHSRRQVGISERDLLEAAKAVSEETSTKLSERQRRRQRLRASYFIGCQLYAMKDARCRRYFWRVMSYPPLLHKAIGKLVLSVRF